MSYSNLQTYGQRYQECHHKLEMQLSIVISRARALLWSATALPDWTPYFTNLLRDSIAAFLKGYSYAIDQDPPSPRSCAERLAFRTVRVPPGSDPIELVITATKHVFDSAFAHAAHFHDIIDHVASNLRRNSTAEAVLSTS